MTRPSAKGARPVEVERLPFLVDARAVARMLCASVQDIEHSERIGQAAIGFYGRQVLYRRDHIEVLVATKGACDEPR